MYWVLILCSVAAGVGLLTGCVCRVAGKTDQREELKEKQIPKDIKVNVTVATDQFNKAIKDVIEAIGRLYMQMPKKKKKFRWVNYYKAKAMSLTGEGNHLKKSSECQCLTCANSDKNEVTRSCSKGLQFCSYAACASCRWIFANCRSYDEYTSCQRFIPKTSKSRRTCGECGYSDSSAKCRIGKKAG
ncbi:hypothetical protein SAMN04488500_10682 [Sporomusa malonica]|uniref:Uncharacterized protein n=1 Tax=Sporomusa malonica TaxID=112901 RepID=A0A1W2ASE5_9FIRM|nr:hypothetical protein SAMN04488500_10682 [Sporomusa malonica]